MMYSCVQSDLELNFIYCGIVQNVCRRSDQPPGGIVLTRHSNKVVCECPVSLHLIWDVHTLTIKYCLQRPINRFL